MLLAEATAAFTRAYHSMLGQVSAADIPAFREHALSTVDGHAGRPAKRACLSEAEVPPDTVVPVPHPRFAALRIALAGKHRQELAEVDAMATRAAGSTSHKRCESTCVGLLHLPDTIFAHVLRFLSPCAAAPHKIDRGARIANTKDVLNVELICWDALQFSRRCAEMDVWCTQNVVDGLDAKDSFFYKFALLSCRDVQRCGQTCFSERDENVHAWLQALYQQGHWGYISSSGTSASDRETRPSAYMKLPTHSVLMILQAVEPRMVKILQASLQISVHEQADSLLTFKYDHSKFEHEYRPSPAMMIVSDLEVQCAAALMSEFSEREGYCSNGLSISDGQPTFSCAFGGFVSAQGAMPFDEQLLLSSIRKLGHRAGIPRMSGSAFRATLAIMNSEVFAILRSAAVLALHDNDALQRPPYPEDWQDAMSAFALSYTQPVGELPEEGRPELLAYYPTSACIQEGDDVTVLLGQSVIERACELHGYRVYGSGLQFVSSKALHEMSKHPAAFMASAGYEEEAEATGYVSSSEEASTSDDGSDGDRDFDGDGAGVVGAHGCTCQQCSGEI
jgi:hypothetical protein